jgi:hypothetical protein
MNTQTKQHIQFFARLLLVLSLVAPVSAGQSSGTPPAKPGSSGGSADSSEPKLGFSIETEMLTYKSLQANSEAVACDIARHLFGGEIGPPTENAPCTIRSNSDPGAGIVIVSSETTVFSDFQLWRADMASMIALEARANQFCPATPTVKTRGLPATAAAATPEGQMLPMAKEVLGLFANTESISPVTGTIHDQALLNGVARQLRALRIAVLIPEIYSPYALGGADSANSPYLSNLAKIIASRSCLQGKKDLEPKEQQTEAAEIGSVITSIDQFVGSLNPPPASAGGGGAARTPATGSTPPESPAGLATHLASALTADGLARAIGVNLDGTASTGSLWQHILWLKALESGGSVAKQGNIFGTKTRFSGGAVTTYALYNFDGNLDCSGNVYDFEGSVLTKDFSKTFREQIKDPTKQLAYLRGGCGPAKQ